MTSDSWRITETKKCCSTAKRPSGGASAPRISHDESNESGADFFFYPLNWTIITNESHSNFFLNKNKNIKIILKWISWYSAGNISWMNMKWKEARADDLFRWFSGLLLKITIKILVYRRNWMKWISLTFSHWSPANFIPLKEICQLRFQ